MTITPETNATLPQIASALMAQERICICGHVNPDGDCIGSTLGLAGALRAAGKTVFPLLASSGMPDPTFSFMPGFDTLVPAAGFSETFDTFVSVDVPNGERLGEAAFTLQKAANLTVTLDHHWAPARMSDLSYTDPESASATLIIWELAKHFGIASDSRALRDLATCCYAGLLTDTGRFMYQNTNAEAFARASEMVGLGIDVSGIATHLFQERSLASTLIDTVTVKHMVPLKEGKAVLSWISEADMDSCGAETPDTESAINVIRSVRGVEVACLLKEREGVVRGSLRAKGNHDVSQLARKFGGGGHQAAAGFTLEMSLDEAVALMRSELTDFFD